MNLFSLWAWIDITKVVVWDLLSIITALVFLLPPSQDTVTGFLLAGVGHRNADGSNFLIVKQDTKLTQVEDAFRRLSSRDDVGIILINQHIANNIRHVLKDYNQTIPTVLEIPSKEHPYDPEHDYIMQRVNMFLGAGF